MVGRVLESWKERLGFCHKCASDFHVREIAWRERDYSGAIRRLPWDMRGKSTGER